jgi:hypothetical protein
MTGIAKYTTISDLEMAVPIRNLTNCCIDRSGASILDYDVIRNIEDFINKASGDLDAVLRRYTSIPIDPTITELTGTFKFGRGSLNVNITGGAATSELQRGDEIRPDSNEDVRLIVSSVTDDTKIVLKHVYYGETSLDSASSKYVSNVPKEVNELCTDHCSWLIWGRRTEDINNPMARKEIDYLRAIEEIRTGKFRFTKSGAVVKTIPTVTDTEIEKIMTDENLDDFTLNEYVEEIPIENGWPI